METTEKCGLTVSRLTLGTVQLGMSYGVANRTGMPTPETSSAVLDAACAGGVVSFDTANLYGQSESLLGRYFQNRPATIVTKLQIRPEAGAGYGDVEREMRRAVETSLGELQLSRIPLILLHNSSVLGTHGAIVRDCFRAMKRDGLIEHAGVSLASNLREDQEAAGDWLFDETFEAVQLPINVLDHRPIRSGTLKRLQNSGKLVFARSIFLQGLIHLAEEQLPDGLKEYAGILTELRGLAESCGLSVLQLAVSFIRDMDGVDSLVIGAETPEQVNDNLRLLEGPSLPEPVVEEILQVFSNVPDRMITPGLWPPKK